MRPGPQTERNGVFVPVTDGDQTKSQSLCLDRDDEFAKLVKLIKEQVHTEDIDIGRFVEGKFTRERPISRVSIDSEMRLVALKHIVSLLR